uniref:Uncharacterized protein n=1 Tax=Anguilla anguilla TaxID=7936 RepID=A0A0E9SVY6_ANGAN
MRQNKRRNSGQVNLLTH